MLTGARSRVGCLLEDETVQVVHTPQQLPVTSLTSPQRARRRPAITASLKQRRRRLAARVTYHQPDPPSHPSSPMRHTSVPAGPGGASPVKQLQPRRFGQLAEGPEEVGRLACPPPHRADTLNRPARAPPGTPKGGRVAARAPRRCAARGCGGLCVTWQHSPWDWSSMWNRNPSSSARHTCTAHTHTHPSTRAPTRAPTHARTRTHAHTHTHIHMRAHSHAHAHKHARARSAHTTPRLSVKQSTCL